MRAGAAGLACLAFETHSAHATHSRSRPSGKEAEEQAQKRWVSSGKSPSTAGLSRGSWTVKPLLWGIGASHEGTRGRWGDGAARSPRHQGRVLDPSPVSALLTEESLPGPLPHRPLAWRREDHRSSSK